MPTYSYRCTSCGTSFDITQSFTDDALTTCDTCGGALRKLFNTIGVTFNGSGFYRTDSRTDSRSAAEKPSGTAPSTESTSSTNTAQTSGSPAPSASPATTSS